MSKSKSRSKEKSPRSNVEEKKDTQVTSVWSEIPENMLNVCGVIDEEYLIVSPIDDPIERDFGFYHLYSFENPEIIYIGVIARPEVRRARAYKTMNAYNDVLQVLYGKSRHFPKLIKSGSTKKLIFGTDGEQQEEHDPIWKERLLMILTLPNWFVLASCLLSFSPNGTLPIPLALAVGLGMCRALSALHSAGFVNRFVTPHTFAILTPISIENIAKNIIIIDLSLCAAWPEGPSSINFAGSPKYMSLKGHQKLQQQGPCDDIVSVIYIITELISGKLPWRAAKDLSTINKLKAKFEKSKEFKRLPHEIRSIYREMSERSSLQKVNYLSIVKNIKKAIWRKNNHRRYELPKWLKMPDIN